MSDDLPALPTTGYISGRLATEDDVKKGIAVFFIKGEGVQPYSMVIPQFALWREVEGEPGKVCVVVQAEQTPDGVMVGMRDLDGRDTIATLEELQLMGAA